MGAKTSAEMIKALKLADAGMNIVDAARKAGVREGSLYAVIRNRAKKNNVINQSVDTSGIDLGQEIEK